MWNEVNDNTKKAKIDYKKCICLNAKIMETSEKRPNPNHQYCKFVKETDCTSTETDSEKADELNNVLQVFLHTMRMYLIYQYCRI